MKNNFEEKKWIKLISKSVTNPIKLLKYLEIKNHYILHSKNKEKFNLSYFPLKIPFHFLKKIKKGNPNDPILKQFLFSKSELIQNNSNFLKDPLNEKKIASFGFLKKYKDRVLLIIKKNCIVHCRYCFRKYFSYEKNIFNIKDKQNIDKYIRDDKNIKEIILSGGDPLIIKDREFNFILNTLEEIPHIKRIRIHSRIPVIIPERITTSLCKTFYYSKVQIILVVHVNHPNEIDNSFKSSIKKLKNSNVMILNQSVLLKGINDNAKLLINLSEKLFSYGVIPYYLHLLDMVKGSNCFFVCEEKAKKIMRKVKNFLPGYLVPRLVKEKKYKKNIISF